MKKFFYILLALSLLLSVAIAATGCKVAEVAPAQEAPASDGATVAQDDSAVVAKVGEEVITLGEYRKLFDDYVSYFSMFGYDILSDPTQLESFQDNVIDSLVQEKMIAYQAKLQGVDTLTTEQEAQVKAQAAQTMQDMESYYRAMAEEEAAADPSIDVEQYIEERILEEAEYNTGEAMTMETYQAWVEEQTRGNYRSDLLKQAMVKDVTVPDADVQAWYDETLAAEQEAFDQDPSGYKVAQEAYEAAGTEPVAPVTYAPAGYCRIMDIMVAPKASVTENYPDYTEKVTRQDELMHTYGDLAFEDALAGSKANAAEMGKLLAEYKTLKAETDKMEEEVNKDARAAIEEAYAKLQEGMTFESLQLRYTENPSFTGNEKFMMGGMLIDPKAEDTGWSAEVTEAFAKLKKGEYSPIFKDADGYHIVYYLGDEPAGVRPLADLQAGIHKLLLAEVQDAEWSTLLETWLHDESVVKIYTDVYRGVGASAQG